MLDKLKEIIVNYVEVAPEDITEDSRFVEDLGFNSYDFMCMLGDIEAETGITVDEEKVVEIHTVGEAIEYIKSLEA